MVFFVHDRCMKGIEMVTGRLGEDMKLETKKPLTPRTSKNRNFQEYDCSFMVDHEMILEHFVKIGG